MEYYSRRKSDVTSWSFDERSRLGVSTGSNNSASQRQNSQRSLSSAATGSVKSVRFKPTVTVYEFVDADAVDATAAADLSISPVIHSSDVTVTAESRHVVDALDLSILAMEDVVDSDGEVVAPCPIAHEPVPGHVK